jgi:hypothetical protein
MSSRDDVVGLEKEWLTKMSPREKITLIYPLADIGSKGTREKNREEERTKRSGSFANTFLNHIFLIKTSLPNITNTFSFRLC